jgi:hypothetical protein
MSMTPEQYRETLRTFIKDNDTLNRLLKFKEENTDELLDLYLNMALGFLNSIPPMIGEIAMPDFPVPALLLHQAAVECLISNGILSARNDLTYNNGGVTVKVSDGNRYLQYLQILMRTADVEINTFRQMKIAANINAGWGGVFSPYSRLHGRNQSLNPNTLLSG